VLVHGEAPRDSSSQRSLHHEVEGANLGQLVPRDLALHDILEAIVGDVRTHGEPVDTPVVLREDGSWLINGDIPVAELKNILSVKSFPGEDERQYRTLAGLVLFLLGRIPRTGDTAESGGLRYEVVDMDGNRIDKVLVTRTGS